MRHFIIFERSCAHCVVRLERAPSLSEAMAAYYVRENIDAKRLEDGSIQTGDGWGGTIIYHHPLECIESMCKSYDGLHGNSWEIGELWDQHWEAPSAQIFCSFDPEDVEEYISACRQAFRADFPASRARAFVWPLKTGPLVTFHQRKSPRRRWPIEVLARYQVLWDDNYQVQPWHGTYDEILEQMLVGDKFYP